MNLDNHEHSTFTVADLKGVQGVRLNPSPRPPFFKISYENEIFGLSKTKLFRFHGDI